MDFIKNRVVELSRIVEAGESSEADERELEALLRAESETERHVKSLEIGYRNRAVMDEIRKGTRRFNGTTGEQIEGPGTPNVKSSGRLDLRGSFSKLSPATFAKSGTVTGEVTISESLAFPSAVADLGSSPLPTTPLFHTLLPTMVVSGPTFVYWRQTARTQNAAVVPAGELKPTSDFAGEVVTGQVSTIASLFGPYGEQALADTALAQIIQQEAPLAIGAAIDSAVLFGNPGTGVGQTEHITGIMNTDGVAIQAFTTDAFTTIRRAVAAQQLVGFPATVLVAHPDDLATLDLVEDGVHRYFGGGPFITGPRQLWSTPVVANPNIPAGEALLADPSQAILVTRQNVTVEGAREAGDLFQRNMVLLRAECRIGLAVVRPQAFRRVELVDGGAGS